MKTGSFGKGSKRRIYLDCALLRSGDILLTISSGLVSRVIRTATKGPYSHAALVIHNAAILEADRRGVGYTPLQRCRVEKLPNPERLRILSEFPWHVTGAKVLRKAGLKIAPEQLEVMLFKIASPLLWREYPDLSNLAATLNSDPIISTLAKPVLRVAEKFAKQPGRVPGAFCSELVATIFDGLNSSLTPGRAPIEFAPNSFLSLGLEVVDGAVTRPDPEAETYDDLLDVLNAPLKMAFLASSSRNSFASTPRWSGSESVGKIGLQNSSGRRKNEILHLEN